MRGNAGSSIKSIATSPLNTPTSEKRSVPKGNTGNLDKPTGVGDHCQATGHSVSLPNTSILTCEPDWTKRNFKEAIYIRERKPTMNRDQGYQLPAIYHSLIPERSQQQTRSLRDQDCYTCSRNVVRSKQVPKGQHYNNTGSSQEGRRLPPTTPELTPHPGTPVPERSDAVAPQPGDNGVDKIMSVEGGSSVPSHYSARGTPGAASPSSQQSSTPSMPEFPYLSSPHGKHVYFCHLCSFSGNIKDEFDAHMSSHFEHSCPNCDYTSRTEGRLKRHVKDFHGPDSAGNRMRNIPGRPKVYRCKQCDFIGTSKVEFWQHNRTHIKEDKLLQCPKCPFVTEYKHHLEYHLRNHFGSKPFKCNKCNYSCVNKSMLNSHMKSHTNVYQYRCADCTYATKYCHSLKLHLRKYNHKPATVLNMDGSLPHGLDVETSGLSLLSKRGPPRGPRGPRRDKHDPYLGPMFPLPQHGLMPGNQGMSNIMMSPYWPLLGQFPNGLHPPPPLIPVHRMPHISEGLHSTPHKNKSSSHSIGKRPLFNGETLKCNLCSFVADSKDHLNRHLLKVHAAENQDLFNMFGISSDTLLEENNHKMMEGEKFYMSSRHSENKSEQSSVGYSDVTGALHVKTDTGSEELPDTTPHSWPSQSKGGNQFSQLANSQSMPDLVYCDPEKTATLTSGDSSPEAMKEQEEEDIIKQMTLRFGSGPQYSPQANGDGPLDLSKSIKTEPFPDEDEAMEVEGDSAQQNSPSTTFDATPGGQRKRSRKGKAYKLYTSSRRKLNEEESPYRGGECDESMPDYDSGPQGKRTVEREQSNESMFTSPKLYKAHNESYLNSRNHHRRSSFDIPDESRFGGSNSYSANVEEFDQIHNSLKILNTGLACPKSVEPVVSNVNGPQQQHPTECNRRNSTSEYANEHADVKTSPQVTGEYGRRKSVSNALRRGTEIAWKILNPYQAGMSALQNGHADVAETQNEAKPAIMPIETDIVQDAKPKLSRQGSSYECQYCDIAFRDCVMYTMHMGYHGYKDPYKCNMCGNQCHDKVDFFLHIARVAHA